MSKSIIKNNICKDINNICFALSNPNKYNLTETFTNINTVIKHVVLLENTMNNNIKYNVKINNTLTDLWIEAEKDSVIVNKINTYGKNRYLAVVLIYLSASYNTIFISNNIDVTNFSDNCHDNHYNDSEYYHHRSNNHHKSDCHHRSNNHHKSDCHHKSGHHHGSYNHHDYYSKSDGNVNLLEHRTDKNGNNSKINSYSLSFCYDINHDGCLKKNTWNVDYNYLQSPTIQQDFINICKSSWVNSVLVGL